MKKRHLVAILLLALATEARAQAGINLAWSDCGLSGTELRSFLCNTNSGADPLVVSFVSPTPLGQLVSVETVIDLQFDDPAYSPWWDFRPSVGCRAGRLNVQADLSASPTSCVELMPASALTLLNAQVAFNAPNRIRLSAVAAVPEAEALSINATDEYVPFKLVLSHAQTVGAGTCGGCDVAACLIVNTVTLRQPAGVGDFILNNPRDRQSAFWQCPGTLYTEGLGCGFYCPTATKPGTWGAVKGLYR